MYGAERRKCTAQRGSGRCVRCKKANKHRTGKLRRICTVQKGKSAPHRRTVEDMYGAKWRISTAQRSCGRYVRCREANEHRTGKLWMMCTVQNGELVPHRRTAENVCGAKRRKSIAQESCGRCVRCKRANKHRTGKLRRICTVRKGK